MKAVLLPVHPEWCVKIANGEKTIEVRKTRPKIETPFKCYIYCTKSGARIFFRQPQNFGNGKVIGEFVCDEIALITTGFAGGSGPLKVKCEVWDNIIIQHYSCLSAHDICKYLGGVANHGHAWRISDLQIYDEPIGLYEFRRKCESVACEGCDHLKYQRVNSDEYDYDCEFYRQEIPITRPPQSWCYVEALT